MVGYGRGWWMVWGGGWWEWEWKIGGGRWNLVRDLRQIWLMMGDGYSRQSTNGHMVDLDVIKGGT